MAAKIIRDNSAHANQKFFVSGEWLLGQYVVAGRRNDDLCKEIGCSPPTLLRLLSKYGIRPRDDRRAAKHLSRRSQFDLQEATRLYVEDKLNCEFIGKKFGVHGDTVRRRLRESGVRIRHHNETKKGRTNHSRKTLNKMAVALDYLTPDATLKSVATLYGVGKPLILRTLIEAGVPLKGQMWNRSGEGNPNWRPDLTPEERSRRRDSSKSTKFRLAVFSRDGFKCKRCGYDKGKILNAHHIEAHCQNRAERHNPDNGVTLCVPCHRGFHRKYGNQDFGRPELEQWISKA